MFVNSAMSSISSASDTLAPRFGTTIIGAMKPRSGAKRPTRHDLATAHYLVTEEARWAENYMRGYDSSRVLLVRVRRQGPNIQYILKTSNPPRRECPGLTALDEHVLRCIQLSTPFLSLDAGKPLRVGLRVPRRWALWDSVLGIFGKPKMHWIRASKGLISGLAHDFTKSARQKK
jgi:hypothetical protein